MIITAGDKLSLRTRVYNYSLADMDPASRFKVVFFGQEWDNTKPDLSGSTFLIGGAILPLLYGKTSI